MSTRIIKIIPQRLGERKLEFCMFEENRGVTELLIFSKLTIRQASKLNEKINGDLYVIYDGKAFEFAPDPVCDNEILLNRCVAEVA